jgi:putative transposase
MKPTSRSRASGRQYLYRAEDKEGKSVDFLLRAHRDKAAARRYFEKAIDWNGAPETVTVDKSGANLAVLQAINAERETPIKVWQNKYLNNVVEQDHRAIKRIVQPNGLQEFPLRAHHPVRHRADEHDQEGADEGGEEDLAICR